ncbi:MAG: DUF72 domain-containing protein [Acidobacteria bacterium]|nr:MAG: DUF72 domain-containing protein [Acidobacteriota bacterium]
MPSCARSCAGAGRPEAGREGGPRRLRRAGQRGLARRLYSPSVLAAWRRRIAAWRARVAVLAYLNNGSEGFAVAYARAIVAGLS